MHPLEEPLVEIVSSSCTPGAGIWGALDAPAPGTSLDQYVVSATGWVVSEDRRVARVELRHGNEVIGTTQPDKPRPDVLTVHPDNPNGLKCGFNVECCTAGLPSVVDISVVAVLADGTSVPTATMRVRCGAVRSTFSPTLEPILVTSLGRTGTTWLMRLLLEHPSIVVHPTYPYESRFAAYWMQMLRVMAGPADHHHSSHPDTFNYEPHYIGKNPFHRADMLAGLPRARGRLGREYVEHLGRFCQESLESIYRALGEDLGRSGASFFAEKGNPGQAPRLIRRLYPNSREIFLVRDFRDMFSSITAFNEKRGYVAFGREQVASDVQYISRLADSARRLHEEWVQRADCSVLLRYEDLVAEPHESLRTLLDYVGLDHGHDTVDAMIDRGSAGSTELDNHRTATSPQSSIGRWRTDLGSELQRACAEAFGELLPLYGYDE